MFQRRSLILGVTSAAGLLLASCGGGSDGPPLDLRSDVVQLAQSNADLSILVEAISAAGLVDTLKGAGPFTVFAPTNAAFAALLTELGVTKAQLLANKPLLTAVLTYHVLAAKVEKAQIPLGKAVKTVQGSVLKVEANNNVLTITDGRNRTSRIIATDLQARNGVVHVIDKVLLPPNKTIVETAQSLSQFSILVEAVVAAELQSTLSGSGPFTVFAPTNDAFVALLGELGLTKDQLLANKPLLVKVLTYHVLPGLKLKAELPLDTQIATVEGESLRISPSLVITDQRNRTTNIVQTDVLTSNGVIHAVNRVILPSA